MHNCPVNTSPTFELSAAHGKINELQADNNRLFQQLAAIHEACTECVAIAEEGRQSIGAIVDMKPSRDQEAAAAVSRGYFLTIIAVLDKRIEVARAALMPAVKHGPL